jgi:uncharacterized membrane protein YhhN
MVNLLFLFALSAMIGHWFSVYKSYRIGQAITKPAVMIFLFAWLYFFAGLQGALLFFGLGILFSMAGDVSLLWVESRKMFMAGLAAFLMAHICYVIGFNSPLPPVNAFSLFLAVMIALLAARIYKRVTVNLAARGLIRMRIPILLYCIAISIMLLSAMQTIFNENWKSTPALLVSLGASLFFISDVILAYNKFVKPIKNGRLLNLVAYHIGQMLLVIGVGLQFAV